jgi:hypothetical protein
MDEIKKIDKLYSLPSMPYEDELKKYKANIVFDKKYGEIELKKLLLTKKYTTKDTFIHFRDNRYSIKLSDLYSERETFKFKAQKGYEIYPDKDSELSTPTTLTKDDLVEIKPIRDSFKVKNGICMKIVDEAILLIYGQMNKADKDDDCENPFNKHTRKAKMIKDILTWIISTKYNMTFDSSLFNVKKIKSKFPTKKHEDDKAAKKLKS